MQQLFPHPATPELVEAYACPRDWVRVNMIASLDGAATIGGRVGALTGPADQRILSTLRLLADVLVVGAGTVRAEGYAPIEVPPEWRRWRLAAGLAADVPVTVLSHSGELPLESPLFADTLVRPIVAIPAACPRRRELAAVAEVLTLHDGGIAETIATLRSRGFRHILSEGGPGVLAQLVEADLVDELCLTLSPSLVGGRSGRITDGPPIEPRRLALHRVLTEDGHLFTQYRRRVD